MLFHGTATVEAKSGYGLSLKDEIKEFLFTSLVSSFDAPICSSIFFNIGNKEL
jgi:hypothetical protein